uniref:SH3 domain and tetratricopeptide repeat-containing protein 1-like n=1 Tax=Sinocyclocheilus grahami TaxID=75366 RepID=A0A672PXA9_SINGR
RTICITFKNLEEIWKFSTYHKMGFLGQCMENLLMNQEFWLISLDQHSGIEISIKEETLNLMYKGFLMQEVGVCEATEEYDADGPDELSFQAGERIIILGLLVACFEWFLGKLERTGDTGLVKTNLVKTTSSSCESFDIFLNDEDRQIVTLDQEKIKEEAIALLKKICQSDVDTNYKLGESQRNNVSSVSIKQQMKKEADDMELSRETPRFSVCSEQDSTSPDGHHALLSFLSSRDHQPEFLLLYSAYPEFLISLFEGHSDEEEIVVYLGVARELARKKHVSWAQSRICFLLGQLCAGRSKFSQARVYYEEALNVPRDCFTDMFLLSAIYSNLALIYLTQKNHEKCVSFSERLSALLMAVPDCLFGCEDPEVLKYVLKKVVLAKNQLAEARACFLLAKLHLKLKDGMSAIPFIERLVILADEVPEACEETMSHVFLVLARLYSDQRLPRLAESCVGATMSHCLCSVSQLLENSSELYGVAIPTQIAPYLTRAAALVPSSKEPVLGHVHALCLSWLFHRHGMPDRAVRFMSTVLDHSGMSSIGHSDTTAALLWLAWLYICNQQPGTALEVLDAVLSSLPEHCTTQLEGVVYNMRAISYRHSADIRQAAESYQAAIEICEEFEDRHNWAIALANFGFMCLHIKAKRLAEEYLTQSVELFSELEDEGHELSFILVLTSQKCVLLCMTTGQVQATRHLCQLYEEVCPDEAQCIIYNEHQLNLLQRIGDKSLEGEILEKISQLYLNLATEKASRAALDYTKQSLGIFIDLGRKRKEAHAWLKAGKIYHILQQTELVDLYVQVAQDMALSTGDTFFTLEMLEAAGDVFFNSSQDREKAICFYRDRALPIAVKMSSVRSQLRLCNKLSELLLQLGQCSEAIEYAQTSFPLSVYFLTADHLNERVAFHRLATLYHCLGQFEMAEHHFLKALSLCPSPLQYDEEALYYVRVYKTLGDIIFYDVKVSQWMCCSLRHILSCIIFIHFEEY